MKTDAMALKVESLLPPVYTPRSYQPGFDFLDFKERPPHGVQRLDGGMAGYATFDLRGKIEKEQQHDKNQTAQKGRNPETVLVFHGQSLHVYSSL